MTYAGRLDPMAEGLLLIISGEDLTDFSKHLKHPKSYEAVILFGFKTDSFDLLGIPQKINLSEKKLKMSDFKGRLSLELPRFSSYRVKGKPLFQWAREGKISEINIPEKSGTVFRLEKIFEKDIKEKELRKEVVKRLSTVEGDFRQKTITEHWKNILSPDSEHSYPLIKISVDCSSGFYIRSLADHMGKSIDSGAVLFSLKRVKVGDYETNHEISKKDGFVI